LTEFTIPALTDAVAAALPDRECAAIARRPAGSPDAWASEQVPA
jgi:hypothetical protein